MQTRTLLNKWFSNRPLAFVCAALIVVILLGPLSNKPQTVDVILARHFLNAGHIISMDDVVTMPIDIALVPEGCVLANDIELILNSELTRIVGKNEPLNYSALKSADLRSSLQLRPGQRLTILEPANIESLGDFLRINDRVDVLWRPSRSQHEAKTYTLFGALTINGIRQDENGTRLIFYLPVKQAVTLEHAKTEGVISVLLRHPAHEEAKKTPSIDTNALVKKLTPVTSNRAVEIIYGK